MYYLQCVERPELVVGLNCWANSPLPALASGQKTTGFRTMEEARKTLNNPDGKFITEWVYPGEFHVADYTWKVVKQVITYVYAYEEIS